MFTMRPFLKISLVFLVCLSMAYVNFLLHHAEDFTSALRDSQFLVVSACIYLAAIGFFANCFWKRKHFFVLAAWLVLNLSFAVNFLIYLLGNSPPLYVQYSQSTALFVFAVLLAVTNDRFPNWLRIFSMACLLLLIPCIVFYFQKMWTWYEYSIYVICFTPMLLSFVFLKEIPAANYDVIDAD